MQIISSTTQFHIEEPTAVAVGKFDGLHLGHRALLEKITAAGEHGLKAAVFTFDPSPGVFFQAQRSGEISRENEIIQGGVKDRKDLYRELMTGDEKREAFRQMGIDYLVEYPFNEETAAVTPEDYVNLFLLRNMNARLIVAGEDVSFGYRGAGDAALLSRLVSEYNRTGQKKNEPGTVEGRQVETLIIPKICWQEHQISSTLVRDFVSKGEMETAAKLLGTPYSISGVVEHGDHRGHSLGMPTANLYPAGEKLLPPNGVYFSEVLLFPQGEDASGQEERILKGITNIGRKPTINGGAPQTGAETNLFDFDEDIYGRRIEVRLLHFHRPELRFNSLEELMARMKEDAEKRKLFDEKMER